MPCRGMDLTGKRILKARWVGGIPARSPCALRTAEPFDLQGTRVNLNLTFSAFVVLKRVRDLRGSRSRLSTRKELMSPTVWLR